MGFDDYGISPWIWILRSLMTVIVLGGTILLVVRALRAVGRPRPGRPVSAFDVPKRRVAAGEIAQDKYEKTRRLRESGKAMWRIGDERDSESRLKEAVS